MAKIFLSDMFSYIINLLISVLLPLFAYKKFKWDIWVCMAASFFICVFLLNVSMYIPMTVFLEEFYEGFWIIPPLVTFVLIKIMKKIF